MSPYCDKHARRLKLIPNLLLCLLIVRVTVAIVFNYRYYLRPDFTFEFLQDRETYFFGSYQWAFYTHIFFGSVTSLLGIVLVSDWFRIKFPRWHRISGRVQVASVLFFVVPSGLWMAFHTESGVIASAGFASLAVATGLCVGVGFQSAAQHRCSDHRRWMCRCYLLLCSAVVLRIMGGLVTVTGFNTAWSYPFAAGASWLLPLIVFEVKERAVNSQDGTPVPS